MDRGWCRLGSRDRLHSSTGVRRSDRGLNHESPFHETDRTQESASSSGLLPVVPIPPPSLVNRSLRFLGSRRIWWGWVRVD